MKLIVKLASWAIAAATLALRLTWRLRLQDDPRPALRAAGRPYVYALLHAHQLASTIDSEPGTAAMVSRSQDGELIVGTLKALGIVPIRGSSGKRGQDKGGMDALEALAAHVAGGKPAYIAVDGPRGPRNRVRKGIAVLAQRTGAVVLVAVGVPTRRWILSKSWDRLQIPQPFARIDGYFSEPLEMAAGEGVEEFRKRIEESLNALEARWDPVEVERCGVAHG
jgi:lysophospholipid acyltransferase (LPLAT)-like uncharacterized protein